LSVNQAAFEEASSCTVGKTVNEQSENDVKILIEGLTLPMNEDQLYRH